MVGDLKKHRGFCNRCPNCGRIEKKKSRLLKHIDACLLKQSMSEQQFPLDLTSPMKRSYMRYNHIDGMNLSKHTQIEVAENQERTLDNSKLDHESRRVMHKENQECKTTSETESIASREDTANNEKANDIPYNGDDPKEKHDEMKTVGTMKQNENQ